MSKNRGGEVNVFTVKRELKRTITAVALIISSLSPLANVTPALAGGSNPTINNAASLTAIVNTATPVTGLSITASGNPTIPINLHVSNGSLAMGTTTGLTFTGSNTGATLEFSGTVSALNTALATLTYTASALGSDTLEVSLIGPDQVYYPTNGHLYEFVTVPGGINWQNASTAAAGTTMDGLTGYLTTITSQGENDFVAARLSDAGWMGANDLVTKHTWQWADGPEAGTNFWQGLGNSGGHTLNGAYANWNNGEPNDSGGIEDCGQFLSGGSGQWNDLPCTVTNLPGYVVEFGAPGNLPSVASANEAITSVGPSVSVSSCTQLAALDQTAANQFATVTLTHDIDCTGLTVSPLFTSAGFSGTFNGQGHTISNITMSLPGQAYVGLFGYTNGATIENVNLNGGTINGEYYVGGLIGYAQNTSVENVTSNLTVTSPYYYVGGLVGAYVSADTGSYEINDSSSIGTVTSSEGYAGGLIGYTEENTGGILTIKQSYATGNVSGNDGNDDGGLVGWIGVDSSGTGSQTILQDDYARGNVNIGNNQSAGGLVGYLSISGGSGVDASATIARSYATGTVTATQWAGGLIGALDELTNANTIITLTNNFAAGLINAGDPTGGLIGNNNADNSFPLTASGNYYDQARTTASACAGDNALTNGCTAVNATGQQPGYFKNNHTNAPLSAWNFSTIWFANANDYPTFAASSDGDGVSSAIENAAPNSGDANNDGLPDDQEANVTSFVDPVTGHYVSVALNNVCSNSSVSAAAESADATQDSGYKYPAGLVSFASDCGTVGFTATVHLYYYGVPAASLVARKYNATSHGYSMVPSAGIAQTTIGGQEVAVLTYQITDGGSLDQDNTANAIIIDPVGLATSALGAPDTGLGGLAR